MIHNQEPLFVVEKEEIDQLDWKEIEQIKKILVNNQDPNWIKKPWDKKVLEWLKTL